MSTASTTLTQPTPQQLSHAVTEIGRLTLQGSSEVYSLGQLALAWLERPEGYRNLEVVANAGHRHGQRHRGAGPGQPARRGALFERAGRGIRLTPLGDVLL